MDERLENDEAMYHLIEMATFKDNPGGIAAISRRLSVSDTAGARQDNDDFIPDGMTELR